MFAEGPVRSGRAGANSSTEMTERSVMPRPSTYPVFERPSGWNALLPPRAPKTKAELEAVYEYVVIGAGYTGLAVARRLAELNSSATILLLGQRRSGREPRGAIQALS
jgi:NADPH-dependent 2,4-dienoyl-CoA reductase/sulfur reductase-like enzyme